MTSHKCRMSVHLRLISVAIVLAFAPGALAKSKSNKRQHPLASKQKNSAYTSTEIRNAQSDVRTLPTQITQARADAQRIRDEATKSQKSQSGLQGDVTTSNTALTDAQAKTRSATASFHEAAAAADRVRTKLMADFNSSDRVVNALKLLDEAHAAQKVVEDGIIARLLQSADYRAIEADSKRAEEKVTELRSQTDADPSTLAEASTAWIAVKGKLETARNDAFTIDAAHIAAAQKTADAEATLRSLRADFETSLSNGPEMSPLLAALKAAKEGDATAQKLVKASQSTLDSAKSKAFAAQQSSANSNQKIRDADARVTSLQQNLDYSKKVLNSTSHN